MERIAKENWNAKDFFEEISKEIIQKVGEKKVFLLVSGGVDSTVLFALLNKVLGQEKVLGLHIDSGLMRLGESEDILKFMRKNGFDNLQIYDASADFLSALAGVFEPEKKREIIGNMFMEIKSKAQDKLGLNESEWLVAQGTIYPDVVETGSKSGGKVKTHHNRVDMVVELIEKGLVIEPLVSLYKDEVRKLGEYLGIPKELVWRHPFPGPGLGVRCLCSDEKSEEYDRVVDFFDYKTAVLPVSSVGVKNGERTYAHPALLFGDYNYENLSYISSAITSNCEEINRVAFSLFSECGDKKYSLIEGYCTKDRLDKLRAVDKIANDAIISTGEYEKIWQMPVVLLPLVNSKGNETIVLRPINSTDAMTAKVYDLSPEAREIIIKKSREVAGVGDIFIDITNKPPGTIEWE